MANNDHIVTDPQVRAVKEKMMAKLRQNSLLNSVSTVGALIGGPLLAAGIMGLAQTLLAGGAAAATAGGVAALGMPAIISMLAVGAVFVGISVVSAYKASRIWQSKQFDNFEVGAQSTAHHLVQELKGNHLVIVNENETHTRSDGKSWEQFVKDRSATVQSQQIH